MIFNRRIHFFKPYCEIRDCNDKFQGHILGKPSLCDRLCRIPDHWPATLRRTIQRNAVYDAISHEHLLVLARKLINKCLFVCVCVCVCARHTHFCKNIVLIIHRIYRNMATA